jgi:hypothetical protein
MPNLMNEIAQVPDVPLDISIVECREGDWTVYMDRISDRGRMAHFSDAPSELLAYKRKCALAYLGRRAQLHGGVCTKAPRVLTPQVLADLQESNRAKRYLRYPWLEKLITLLAEIESIQDQHTNTPNVLTLVQSV